MITWNEFDMYNSNVKKSFEDMTRLIFKKKYIGDITYNLLINHNNPGIETEPISIAGVLTGFQSKHFSNKVDYSDIKSSIEMTIKNYPLVKKIVLFCNKKISTDTILYNNNISIPASKNNIVIDLFTDENILDYVSISCKEIIPIFFNGKYLSMKQMIELNNNKLQSINKKYFKENHIVLEIEDKINKFLLSELHINEIKKGIDTLCSNISKEIDCKNYPFLSEKEKYLLKRFKSSKDELMKILKIDDINNSLKWHEFGIRLDDVCSKISILSDEFDILYDKSNESYESYEEISRLLNECKNHCLIFLNDFKVNFKYFEKKIMILEGAAGTGKTHLLSRIVDSYCDNNYVMFFLGNKIIGNENPSDSMVSNLGLNGISFIDLLESYDSLAASTGEKIIIVFDALNEVYSYRDWKNYLPILFSKIEKLENVKCIFSIRNTYLNSIFDDGILEKMDNNYRYCILKHYGFLFNNYAIKEFMKFYAIDYTSSIGNVWMTNPLYLKIFCEINKGKSFKDMEKNPYKVFMKFVEVEEKKIRENKDLDVNIKSYTNIVDSFSKKLVEKNTYYMDSFELYKMFSYDTELEIVVKELVKGEVLLAKIFNEKEVVEFCYEKIYDFAFSKCILENCQCYHDLIRNIKKISTTNNDDTLVNPKLFGILSILFSECRQKYSKDLLRILLRSKITKKYYASLIDSYFESFSLNPSIVDKKIFTKLMFNSQYGSFSRCLDIILYNFKYINNFDFFIFDYLFSLECNKLDLLWTININKEYQADTMLKDFLLYCEHDLNANKNRIQILIFLCWTLSSSCRELRDRATKIISINLINDYKVMFELLKKFKNISDVYIKERIYAAIYGAILNSNDSNKSYEFNMVEFIKREVFKKISKNIDILVRDYCCGIVYFISNKYGLQIEDFIFPMYKSKVKLKKIGIQNIKKIYSIGDKNYSSGLKYIFNSMYPDIHVPSSGNMYGDFGRYVFQSRLSYFGKVVNDEFVHLNQWEIEIVFSNAYQYIVKGLGYRDSYFEEYDTSINREYYGRGSRLVERIGKKYQRIAMNRMLAIVSEVYDFQEVYSDFQTYKYNGAWRPFMRDIDPSIYISKNNRNFDLGFEMYSNEYENWDINDKEWYKKSNPSREFNENCILVDSLKRNWVTLFTSKTAYSNKDYRVERQTYWRELSCCLISNNDLEDFINEVKNISFYGRWAHASEGKSTYSIYLKEHYSALASRCEYKKDEFDSLHLNVGYERKLVKTIEFKDNMFFEEVEKEQNVPKYVDSKKIMALHNSYSWDNEYDFSLDETIHVCLPINLIVTFFNLDMKEPGIWYQDKNVVCADFSFVKNSNIDGLYIRKDYLDQFLKQNNYTIIWICLGEKTHSNGHMVDGFNKISGLIYYKDAKLTEIDIYENN